MKFWPAHLSRKRLWLGGLLLLAALGVVGILLTGLHGATTLVTPQKVDSSGELPQAKTTTPPTPKATTPTPTPAPAKLAVLSDPVAGFLSRVTKKPFGIYVTPSNSPVQPEKFTGYHTGADAEYGDVTADVPVYSIAAGTVTNAQYVSGYGGVVVVRTNLPTGTKLVLYGHLRPSSLPAVGAALAPGQQFAVLGTAYSSETAGERRHLHLAILNGGLDWRGYVQNQSELSGWTDPVAYFKAHRYG